MILQELPFEIISNIFRSVDYDTLHTFLYQFNSAILQFPAYSVLHNHHAFITNYNDSDFRNTLSRYIKNIAKIIDRETKNARTSCSICRHTSQLKSPNIFIGSCFSDLKVSPKILTLYLIYPGMSSERSFLFSRLIQDYITIVSDPGNVFLRGIEHINVYVDYDEYLLSQNENFSTDTIIDLSLFRQLSELESAVFSSPLLQKKLNIFSIVTNGRVRSSNGTKIIQGLVDTGSRFCEQISDFTNLTHLSLPHHELFDMDFMMGNMKEKIHLPRNLVSLNLSYSQTLAYNMLNNGQFPHHLEFLNLSGCKIGTFNLEKIKFPNSIKFLNLSNNQIISLENIILPTFLKSLDMSENILITEGLVKEFPSTLTNLNLSCNQISLIESINFPRKLLRLSLSRNYLQDAYGLNGKLLMEFPDTLSYLDLSVNGFTDIEAILLPPHLHELDISNNYISQLDSKIPYSESLLMLNLSGNPLLSLRLFLEDEGIACRLEEDFPRLKALFLNDVDLSAISNGKKWHFPRSVQYLHLINSGIVNYAYLRNENVRILNCS